MPGSEHSSKRAGGRRETRATDDVARTFARYRAQARLFDEAIRPTVPKTARSAAAARAALIGR